MHPGNNAPHTSGNAAQGARGLRRRAIGTASKRLCNAAHRWISWTRSALDPVEMRIRPGSRLWQEDTGEWTCPADPESYAERTYYVRHTSIPHSLPKRSPPPLATAAAPTAVAWTYPCPSGRECTPGRNRADLLRLSARSRRPCPDSAWSLRAGLGSRSTQRVPLPPNRRQRRCNRR